MRLGKAAGCFSATFLSPTALPALGATALGATALGATALGATALGTARRVTATTAATRRNTLLQSLELEIQVFHLFSPPFCLGFGFQAVSLR